MKTFKDSALLAKGSEQIIIESGAYLCVEIISNSANVKFEAETEIKLDGGFEVRQGAVFEGTIK
ncbi:hypothetical protein AwDysgo_09950 [Bacteroidales bacterium]|nr:hypothetical protein AwDysgo_09950 [Bacteroidales bacterium]